jgi:DNA repair exonuclease SbcCD ATPase subunit
LKLLWALRRLPLLRRGPREMARLLGAPPVSGVRARLQAAWQRLRLQPKAPAHEPTPEPGVVQAEVAHAAAARRAHLAQALEEAEGRLRTSQRALELAERDAKDAERLAAARAAAERDLEAVEAELAASRVQHAELSEAVGATAARLEAAKTAAAAAVLNPDAPGHACGQPLGTDQAELRGRQVDELAVAEAAHAEALAAKAAATAVSKTLTERRAALAETLKRVRAAERRAARAVLLAEAASAAMELSLADVAARRQALH